MLATFAGAMGSPQLLMLSGVGPADHLRSFNITLVLNQSAVGQGMADNPMNAIFVPSPSPVEVSLIQVVGITFTPLYLEAGFNPANISHIVSDALEGVKAIKHASGKSLR